MKILLASSSPYRKEQLQQLGLAFETHSPLCDEESFKSLGLSPTALCQRLAFEKAQSLVNKYPDSIIIGSDQLVELEGQILGKPKTEDKALIQLQQMRGKTHKLLTSLCVLYKEQKFEHLNTTQLTLNNLSDEILTAYIQKEKPLDCAGSYKIESQGLFLMESIQSDDFNAIKGLPLLQLTKILTELNYPWYR